ncbi:HTH_Tnp_Tc3_2 domain-containing protein [Trichonephila clavipes]|nr:HTH_Tnp_Tc3_2 domain-containing protein [Trichonephila clavipes]
MQISSFRTFVCGGQLDGWKWDLSQADAARRLNVSRSVVQRLWDQYQSEFCVQKIVPGRPRATTPAEDRFLALSARREKNHYCAAARCRPLSSIRKKKSPLLRCEIVFTMQVCMQEDQLCAFPLNGRQRRNRLCWAREHVSWTQQQWASVLFTDASPDLQWRVIQGVY